MFLPTLKIRQNFNDKLHFCSRNFRKTQKLRNFTVTQKGDVFFRFLCVSHLVLVDLFRVDAERRCFCQFFLCMSSCVGWFCDFAPGRKIWIQVSRQAFPRKIGQGERGVPNTCIPQCHKHIWFYMLHYAQCIDGISA